LRLSPILEVVLGALAGVGFTLLMFGVNLWVVPHIPDVADYGSPIGIFDLFILPIVVAWVVYRKRKVIAFSATMVIVSLLTVELLIGTYYLATTLTILVGI